MFCKYELHSSKVQFPAPQFKTIYKYINVLNKQYNDIIKKPKFNPLLLLNNIKVETKKTKIIILDPLNASIRLKNIKNIKVN